MLKKYFILIALVILAFATRIPYTLHNLDDWDSVQFALAMHEYSIPKDQPHLPGYPLYILSGKLINTFVQNDAQTLTLLSVILGSLAIIPLFLLSEELFNRKTAILASILFLVLPVTWTLSEQALTDIPGLFFLLSFAYLLYHNRENSKAFFATSFFGGFILGFRLNELPIIVGLLGFFLWKKRNPRETLLSLTSFTLGVLAWIIPMILMTGISAFYSSLIHNFLYVVWHDGALAQPTTSIKHLAILKITMGANLINLGYTLWFAIPALFSLIWIIMKKRSRGEYQFLLVWIVFYCIFLFTIFNLELPRFVLPIVPPLVILTSSAFFNAFGSKKLQNPGYILAVLLISVLAYTSWNEVKLLHTTTAPTIAPTIFVKDNFNQSDTVVIASGLYRQFEYYLPNYTVYNSAQNNVPTDLKRQTVIIDHPSLKDAFPALKNYSIVASYDFSESPYLYPKTPDAKIYILKPN